MSAGEITCVVPTHNRPQFLRRLLTFYREMAPSYGLLVADSSAAAAAGENLAAVQALGPDSRIAYRHFDCHLLDKLVLGLEAVRTPFVVLCADDDFLMPPAVVRCAEFLASHPGYASAMGRTVQFRAGRIGMRCRVGKGYSVEQNRPFDRCLAMADQWFTNFYAVYRTEALLGNMRLASRYTDSRRGYYLPEVLLSQLSVLSGRVKVLPFLYSVMEQHGSNAAHTHRAGVRPDAEPQYQTFRAGLVQELERAGIAAAQAGEFVDHWYGFFRDSNPRVRARRASAAERMVRVTRSLGYRLLGLAGMDLGRHRRPLWNADIRDCREAWICAERLLTSLPQGVPSENAKAS